MTKMNVPPNLQGWYLVVFTPLVLVWGVALAIEESGRTDGWVATALAVGQGLEAVVVVTAGLTITLVEGVAMLAEKYLERRYKQGRHEGRAEGRTEGRAEGRTEGRAEGRTEGRTEGRAEALERLKARIKAAPDLDHAAVERMVEEVSRELREDSRG